MKFFIPYSGWDNHWHNYRKQSTPIGVETGPSGVYAEGKMTWAAPGKKTSDL